MIILAVDFDGTVVGHAYPRIGHEVPGAIQVLQKIQHNARLILWTMRDGKELDQAVQYLRENGVALFGINNNPGQKLWTQSPKVHADIYIDDAALGCPLHRPVERRAYVDWYKVGKLLVKRDLLTGKELNEIFPKEQAKIDKTLKTASDTFKKINEDLNAIARGELSQKTVVESDHPGHFSVRTVTVRLKKGK